VVADHDSARLVWAAPGKDEKTVEAFFEALSPRLTDRPQLVSCDMAPWIAAVLDRRCPRAKRCVDPFHVVQLATEALDLARSADLLWPSQWGTHQ
jgi:transposase